MAERLVLFGGTFDPVHHGHLITARAVAEKGGFDRITFVPAYRPPHKPSAVASVEDRLEMLRLAISGETVFDVTNIEIQRGGPSYTRETLCALGRRGGDVQIFWVIGADMLEDLPRWHRVEEVLEMARIVVAARPGWVEKLGETFDRLEERFGTNRVKELRESVLMTPLIDISSSDIRRRLANHRSIRFLVPEAVEAYIRRCGLYR